MKYNILRKIMVTGLSTAMCVGGLSISNLASYGTDTVSSAYATTIKDSKYTATGTINTTVSMRKGPGTSYTRLATLKKGTKVSIVAKSSNSWYKIKYKDTYTYVYSKYVTVKSDDAKTEEIAYSATAVANHAVYVRKSASTSAKQLGYFKKNAKVTIVAKTSNGWYKVKFNGGYGYVLGQYLTISTKPVDTVKYPTTGTTNHAVYVRKGAATSYAKIGTLQKNDKVTILSKTTYGWYKIKYKNGVGYVYSQYVNLNSTK